MTAAALGEQQALRILWESVHLNAHAERPVDAFSSATSGYVRQAAGQPIKTKGTAGGITQRS